MGAKYENAERRLSAHCCENWRGANKEGCRTHTWEPARPWNDCSRPNCSRKVFLKRSLVSFEIFHNHANDSYRYFFFFVVVCSAVFGLSSFGFLPSRVIFKKAYLRGKAPEMGKPEAVNHRMPASCHISHSLATSALHHSNSGNKHPPLKVSWPCHGPAVWNKTGVGRRFVR